MSLWRHRDFLSLWAGQSISEIGSAVTKLALPLTAVVVLDASPFEVGLLTAAATVAFIVVTLPAGPIVDRFPKRTIMIICDAARLLIIGSVPVAWYVGLLGIGQLYAVALAAGACTVFFDVAYQSYVPAIVARDQLADANGRLTTTQELAELTGPGLGSVLVGMIGVAGAMIADAASYLVSLVALTRIRHREPRRPSPPPGRAGRRSRMRAEIAEGMRFVLRHPILRRVVACSATSNLFSSMATAMQVLFLVRVLGVDPAVTGLLLAAGALGGILGGVLSGWLARTVGSARIIWLSILVFGMPQFVAALAHPGWSVVLFPIGFGLSYFAIVSFNVAVVTYRQTVCPPELLGRMNAAIRWVVWSTIPVGGVVAGVLGTAVGIRPTLLVACLGTWAAGLWVFFSPLRRMRDFAGEPQVTGVAER
ncbi:MFS transporter [Pseudonocardia phyllosphaerae]|uniref:MFS transporter n=1 Tax=Pseudonocardia phyllosphaerae TaxID=3390502 RepID=UPI003978F196